MPSDFHLSKGHTEEGLDIQTELTNYNGRVDAIDMEFQISITVQARIGKVTELSPKYHLQWGPGPTVFETIGQA
jgi:hypothetical protein